MIYEGKKAGEFSANFESTIEKEIDLRSISPTPETKNKIIINQNYFIHVFICFLIYGLTFFGFYLLKNKTFYLDTFNSKLFLVYILSMTVSALTSRKFSRVKYYGYGTISGKLFFSLLISLTSLIIFFNLFQMQNKMPAYILGATYFGLIIETFYFVLLGTKEKRDLTFFRYKTASLRYLLLDFLILYFFCFAEITINLIAYKNIDLENEIALVILIFVSWLISAGTTHKFLPLVVSNSKMNAFELQVKFYLQFIVLIALSMISLHLSTAESVYFIKAILGYSFISALISMVVFAPRVENKTEAPTECFLKDYKIQEPIMWAGRELSKSKYSLKDNETYDSIFIQKFQFEYIKKYKELFSALDNMLNLNSFDSRKTIIIDSNEPETDSLQRFQTYHLLVDPHVLNDQLNLNKYFRKIRNKLVVGGVFVGAFHPHLYRYKRFLQNYSFWLGNLFYFFDLIWKRVFPKLPGTRRIYFTFRKEKDQALSLAEGLGRLVYTGFKIIDLVDINDVVYFAAAKGDEPTPDKRFFYSPIFKMERIGKDGKSIYVYKLRTMYPYSEYIQDFVYNSNGLVCGDKITNDFRLPFWGKFFRKYWIDELPMLINLLKGEIKIVGVRPLSKAKFNLYPTYLQKLRTSTKPGLIPPFYKDLPQTFEELIESEKKYLLAYNKNPLKTDIEYFIKSVYNIIFKKARSS